MMEDEISKKIEDFGRKINDFTLAIHRAIFGEEFAEKFWEFIKNIPGICLGIMITQALIIAASVGGILGLDMWDIKHNYFILYFSVAFVTIIDAILCFGVILWIFG